MDPISVLDAVNGVALLVFTALLGSGIFGMIRRLILYQRAAEAVPVILKRDLALLGALAFIGLESLLLRALNIGTLDGWTKVLFVSHWDVILIAALLYWVKVELFDIDNPNVK